MIMIMIIIFIIMIIIIIYLLDRYCTVLFPLPPLSMIALSWVSALFQQGVSPSGRMRGPFPEYLLCFSRESARQAGWGDPFLSICSVSAGSQPVRQDEGTLSWVSALFQQGVSPSGRMRGPFPEYLLCFSRESARQAGWGDPFLSICSVSAGSQPVRQDEGTLSWVSALFQQGVSPSGRMRGPFPEYLLCFSRESDRQAGWGDPFLSICSVSAGSQPVRQDEGTLSWVSALFQQGVSPSGRMRGPFPEYLLCFSRESARQAGWGDPFLSICSVSAGSQPVRQDEGTLSWVSALFQQGVSPSGRMRGPFPEYLLCFSRESARQAGWGDPFLSICSVSAGSQPVRQDEGTLSWVSALFQQGVSPSGRMRGPFPEYLLCFSRESDRQAGWGDPFLSICSVSAGSQPVRQDEGTLSWVSALFQQGVSPSGRMRGPFPEYLLCFSRESARQAGWGDPFLSICSVSAGSQPVRQDEGTLSWVSALFQQGVSPSGRMRGPFPEYLLCFSRESARQAGWGDPFLSICSVSAGSQPVRQDEGTLSWVSALFQQGVSPSGRMRGPFPEYLLCFSRESARQAGWGDPFLSICSVSAGSQPVRQDEGTLSWVSALFQQGVSPSGRMRGPFPEYLLCFSRESARQAGWGDPFLSICSVSAGSQPVRQDEGTLSWVSALFQQGVSPSGRMRGPFPEYLLCFSRESARQAGWGDPFLSICSVSAGSQPVRQDEGTLSWVSALFQQGVSPSGRMRGPFPEYLLCFSRESARQAGWGDPFLSICSVSAGSQPVRQDEGTLSWVSALFQQGVSPSGRMRGPFPEYLLCFSRESARQAGWGDPFLSICSVSAGSQPYRQDEGTLSWVSALFQQGVSPSGRMRGCVYCSMTLEFYALWSASRSLLIAPRKCERAAFIRYKNAFRLELYSRPVYGRSWLTEKHCAHS